MEDLTKKNQGKSVSEDGTLSLVIESEIKATKEKLISEKKINKIYPIVVIGDTDAGEKEYYVAYFREPTFAQFSKYIAASKKDEPLALKTLAKDTFVEGDKDLVDNDSLFLFGTMAHIGNITAFRQGYIVNL